MVYISWHASKQMALRGITPQEVMEVIGSENTVSVPTSEEGVERLTGYTARGKRIRMIYARKTSEVVTVYRVSRKRK